MDEAKATERWVQTPVGATSAANEKEQTRNAEILRMVSAIAAGLCVIYVLFYAWIGFDKLLPIIVLTVIGGVLWAATIPMMRFGQPVAVSYNAIVTATVFVITGWLAGSEPGNHYHLLAAPMLILTLGVKRWKLALALTLLMIGAFLFVEIGLPRVSSISPFPPEVAAIIKPISVLDAALMSFGANTFARSTCWRTLCQPLSPHG